MLHRSGGRMLNLDARDACSIVIFDNKINKNSYQNYEWYSN